MTNDAKVIVEEVMPVSVSKQTKDETNLMQDNQSSTITEEPKATKKEENKEEKKSTETTEPKPNNGEMDEQVDMSGMLFITIIGIESFF